MPNSKKNIAIDPEQLTNIKDFTQAVEVAIALGAKINVLPGMSFYQLTFFPYDGNPYDFGYYSSYSDAEAALANWVINHWDEMASMGSAPWDVEESDVEDDNERKRNYLKDKTNDEIIDEYFHNDEDTYEINYNHIAKSPTRRD